MLLRVSWIFADGSEPFIANETGWMYRLKVSYLVVEHWQSFPTLSVNEHANSAAASLVEAEAAASIRT
jgi:hypothetical protein